ncbi:hypothetical protein [Prochlorococcus marinus]|uniref:hypothetical protein n=1 Tax=Prochlorococcus marinus TaxID=1219 RepID=UPI0022B41CB9|nr:hypothetical protein [Prochlorococcus marinus]
MKKLGDRTCEYYVQGRLDFSESMIQSFKDLGITKNTKFDIRTSTLLEKSLNECGINLKTMDKDSIYKI